MDKTFAALAGSSGRISKAQAAELFSKEGAAEGSVETAQLIWSEMRLPDHAYLSQVSLACRDARTLISCLVLALMLLA